MENNLEEIKKNDLEEMKEKEKESRFFNFKKTDNKNKIAGLIGLVIFSISIYDIFSKIGSIGDYIYLFVSAYIVYTTLYKKEMLTKRLWIIFLIVIGIFIVAFSAGFLIGFTSS